jgi:phosphoglycolate phosphatase
MIKAVIFDWNGVIVDSLNLDHEIFLEECKREGLEVPQNIGFYKDLFNSNIHDNLVRIGFKFGPDDDEFYKKSYVSKIDRAPMFDGIMNMLIRIRKKYKTAILTSNYSEPLETFLRINKMNGMFDILLTADTNRHKDEKIKIMLKKMSLTKDEIIYIGDTASDIEACRKAGIKIIAVTWGYHERKRLMDADFIADKPEDIVKILEKL